MKLLSRCLTITCAVVILAVPTLAQNAGGLPGTEHMLAGAAFQQAERVVLHGDVVHYWFDVAVGPGAFETIRIHRVVKETSPGRPVPGMEGVLLLPGAQNLFEAIFMPPASTGVPAQEGSVALFLASNGVDVWGMDYGWNFIPYGTTDFAFLEGWGIAKDAEHVRTALSIARWVRATSQQGAGPINVLGFSYGGFLAYAVAGEDTQRPGNLKNVKGIIPVDPPAFKLNRAAGRTNACNRLPNVVADLAAGMLVFDGSDAVLIGQAALNEPDDLSPFGLPAWSPYFLEVPPNTFTNFQWALALYVWSGFFGGTYAPSPPSVATSYTSGPRIIDLLANAPAYYPYQWAYDSDASRCESADYPVTFDDHLGEVTVPIFGVVLRPIPYLDASTRTVSLDVTSLVLNPTFSPELYGHADLFLADDAASVVWRPILDWILAHR